MRTRHRIAAGLHIAVGCLIAALVAVLWICLALLAPVFEGTFVPDLFAMFGQPLAVATLAYAGLEVAAAIALLRAHRWARYALGAVSLTQFAIVPIGTALSVYTFWVLISDER